MKKIIVLLVLLAFIAPVPVLACTIFISANGKQVLVGNNEDYSPKVQTFLWVRPQQQLYNGYVFWGFEEKYPEGGMNDKGLFYDAAALPQKIELKKDPSKPDFEGYIVEKVLKECSTVEEVVKWVSRYNLTWYEKAQVFVADKTGDYAIINASYIIRPKKSVFVLTNYNLNEPVKNDFSCWRRNTAEFFLTKNAPSPDLFKIALNKVSQNETDNKTLYSQVCDLKNTIIYLYQQRNFSAVKKIKVDELLKTGKMDIEIKTLFPENLSNELLSTYTTHGFDKAMALYESKRNDGHYVVAESDLEDFGYSLIDSNKVEDAVKVLAVNVKQFPNSDKANAALATAYLLKGDQDSARKYYANVAQLNKANFYLNTFGASNEQVFFINGMEGAKKIALVGEFNKYDTNTNLFVKKGNGWTCTIKLPAGEYAYKLYVDDSYWMQDPSNKLHLKPGEWWDSRLVVKD